MIVSCVVNGEAQTFEVEGFESLLWALRERLDLLGTKDACEQGECGSCSVLLDGDLVCSCLVMAPDAEGSEVTTVEGIGSGESLHAVQQTFLEAGAAQCGFCTPGIVVASAHLLDHTRRPSRDEIREALAGNLCRCTGYGSVVRAVEAAAERSRP